jgi:hypothetical protein
VTREANQIGKTVGADAAGEGPPQTHSEVKQETRTERELWRVLDELTAPVQIAISVVTDARLTAEARLLCGVLDAVGESLYSDDELDVIVAWLRIDEQGGGGDPVGELQRWARLTEEPGGIWRNGTP